MIVGSDSLIEMLLRFRLQSQYFQPLYRWYERHVLQPHVNEKRLGS